MQTKKNLMLTPKTQYYKPSCKKMKKRIDNK